MTGAGATIAPEDRARADFYALLSSLFAEPPDAALLRAIAGSREALPDAGGSALAQSWRRLADAASVMDPDAAAEEYTRLFVGVGKSEVQPFATYYLRGRSAGNPLVEIRNALAGLGLARQPGRNMVEDHIAALLETMRLLVAGGPDIQPATLDDQRVFFQLFLSPWYAECCSAIEDCAIANFYRLVAEFTRSFLNVEKEAFAFA